MAWRAPVVRRSRLQGGPAAGDGYPCPRYVAALVRGQKDIHRRKFGGLTRPALGGVLAEVGNLLRSLKETVSISARVPHC